MTQTSVFKSNKTQAIRLAKAVAFPEHVKEVEVIKVGSARLVTPVGGSWDAFFNGPQASDDFLTARAQPATQERGTI
jgi:antitoxin VapB